MGNNIKFWSKEILITSSEDILAFYSVLAYGIDIFLSNVQHYIQNFCLSIVGNTAFK